MIQLRTGITTESAAKSLSKRAFERVLARSDLGFLRLPLRRDLMERAQKRAFELSASKMIVLGIGGSSLGPKALLEACRKTDVEFFENVDALEFWSRLDTMEDPKDCHWVIISKSGSTLETLSQANFVAQHLRQGGLQLAKNATVISETKSSPLTDWARDNQVSCLEIPTDVGGRFSVLSPVGLLPAAFCRLDLEAFLKGAAWALEAKDLVVELTAQSQMSFQRSEWISVFWMYSTLLRSYSLWCQQLWAESLAKKEKRSGGSAPRASTPLPLVGAIDQHSVLQQLAEGARDKCVWFFGVKECEVFGPVLEKNLFRGQDFLSGKGLGDLLKAECDGTRASLAEVGVSTLKLEVGRLDEGHLGALFMLMELVVAALGEILDVDAFDQPGVERSKILTRQALSPGLK